MQLQRGQLVTLKVPEPFGGRLNPGDTLQVRVTRLPEERDNHHGYHFAFEKMINCNPESTPPVHNALIFERGCSYISRRTPLGERSFYQILVNDPSYNTDVWKMPA